MGIPENPAVTPIRFLKLAEVVQQLGISKSEVFRRIHSVPNFPKPIRMGTRCVVYSSAEVDSYMRQCIAKRDAREQA